MPYKDLEKAREAGRRFRAAHPGYYVEKTQKNKLRIRAIIDELKNSPCLDCGGEYPPIAMDFDHVRGEKKFNISKAWTVGIGNKRLMEEIEKCELVCANCHRIRSAKRLENLDRESKFGQ